MASAILFPQQSSAQVRFCCQQRDGEGVRSLALLPLNFVPLLQTELLLEALVKTRFSQNLKFLVECSSLNVLGPFLPYRVHC